MLEKVKNKVHWSMRMNFRDDEEYIMPQEDN